MRILKDISSKERKLLGSAILLFVLNALASVGIMATILLMINEIVENHAVVNDVIKYWIILIGLLILKGVFNAGADLSKHFAGFEIVARIRENITLRLKRFSLGFYTRERLGEISTIVHKDVDNIEGVVAHLWTRMISDLIVSLIIGIGLFVINWKMGIVLIALLPFAILILVLGIKSNGKLEKITQDNLATMVSLFVEYTKGIPLIKAFTENMTFFNRLQKSVNDFRDSSQRISKSSAGYIGGYFFFLEISYGILAAVGAYMILGEQLNIIQYLLFIIFSTEFYKPFASAETHWLNYIKVKDSYQRILTIIDEPIVEEALNPKVPANYEVEFDKVNFFYENDGFALKEASFTIKEGSLAALVGPSGSGKTTVTNLLLRFWDPQQGHIKIGGVDIREMNYDDLLSDISIVMQNVILFADTIYENIKVGKRDATREEVMTAAKKAMIHDFIESLPLGYDTPIGENGAGLSGGQKQRISIARAFLKDTPIILLDEATSNVDPINERKIQKAISKLAAGRTVIVIAHHLHTIRSADQIIVFNNGEIIETGVHDALLSQKGLYHELWYSQEKTKTWKLCS